MYTILVHHPNRLKYLGPLGTISVHDFRTCFFFRKFTKYCHADAESDSGLDEPHVFKMNNGKSTSPKIAVATSDSQPSLRGGRFFKERSTENGELPSVASGQLVTLLIFSAVRTWLVRVVSRTDRRELSMSRYLCTELKIMYARYIHHTQNWKLLCWWESR